MNKRIKYEETETHLKLWVDGALFANIIKKGAEAFGFTPFQYLCMTIASMQVIQPDAPRSLTRTNYIWEIWLAELLEEIDEAENAKWEEYANHQYDGVPGIDPDAEEVSNDG